MASRLNLHEELCVILGNRNVYYQPPESIKMAYPCIVYARTRVDTRSANDRNYKFMNQYEITVIDGDPDSDIPDKILAHFSMCRFDRCFVTDNLNHSVCTLYY